MLCGRPWLGPDNRSAKVCTAVLDDFPGEVVKTGPTVEGLEDVGPSVVAVGASVGLSVFAEGPMVFADGEVVAEMLDAAVGEAVFMVGELVSCIVT